MSYKPKINTRTVQGEINGDGAGIEMVGQGETGQATVTDKSWAGVSIHVFWNWDTSSILYMRIVNLDAGPTCAILL